MQIINNFTINFNFELENYDLNLSAKHSCSYWNE